MNRAALELVLLDACREHEPEDAVAALAAVQARLHLRDVRRSIADSTQEAAGNGERMLTVREAADYLGVSEKWIRARQERLECKRLGRAVRIPFGAVKRAAKLGM